jgi:MFS family permease
MPNKLRPWALGVSQAMASAFVVLGTFLAAAFVRDNTGGAGGWRWAYYFNGIIYAVTAISIIATYFPPRPVLGRHHVLKEILSGVDYIGILAMSGSFASLIIGLTWGGSTYAWNSKQVIATLTMGCVGLVLFGLYEAFIVKEGILDHRLFQTLNFPILLFVCTIDGMLLLGVNVLYAQEIFDLFSNNSIRIAVILSPYLITSTFGCIPAGWLMASTKSYRVLLVSALFWCSLFTGKSCPLHGRPPTNRYLGLMSLVNSKRLSWAYAFSTLFGIGTAVTTVIPS